MIAMRKDLHFNIDLTLEPRYTKEFVVKQNDSVNLFINLKSNGTPISVAEQTPRLFVRKPNGSIVVQGGTDELGDSSITLDANTVIVELKNSALNTTGLCYAELELEDERGTLITQTFIFEVIDRLAEVEEAIKAVDDIYLLGEIEKFIIQAKIDMALLKEQIAEGLVKIEEFNEFVVEKSEALQDLIDKALDDITTTTKDISEKGEYYLSNITGLGESYGIQIERLGEEFLLSMSMKADEVLNLIRDERESAIEDITVLVDTSKEILRMKTYEGMTQIRECVSSEINKIGETAQQQKDAIDEVGANAITAVEDTKDNALEEIEGAKTDAVNTIDAREEEIMKNLESITIDGTGILDNAVKLAEQRLQAQTVQSMWEVQEKSATEQENLERVSRQEQSNISQKANEQIERVNQAGADMVELVENLDANVEAGLNEINTAIRTGKAEINELSSTQIEKIKAEGEEIISMVENIETITGDHIEKIVKAGETNTNRVENMANSCIREINSVASEQKELIRDAGNEKLEEINSILGVSKGEVEELLETTRQEIQTHRTEIATRVNLGKEEIDALKNNSLVEMTDAKDGLIEEILGAEIALKEDFTQLRDQYLQEIDDRGQLRVDALEKMIDRIDALQEAVEKDLEVSEKRAEMLDNKLVDVDNKMDEVRPILDSLTEMRNICISLQQENATAKENIDTLDFLHIEADVRIVELRRLIELADVVIEARSGNHDEINARLDALEQALAELEIPDISHLATKEELEEAKATINDNFSNYYTKEETDKIVSKIPQQGYIGKLGPAVKVASDIDRAFDNVPEAPEVEGSEYIGKFMYSFVSNSNTIYKVVYLYNSPSKNYYPFIYVSPFVSGNCEGVNYYFKDVSSHNNYATGRAFEKVGASGDWVSSSSFANFSDIYTTKIYYNDIPIYTDINKSDIYRESSIGELIGDANNANQEGRYLVKLSMSEYAEVQNLPDVKLLKDIETTLHCFVRDNGDTLQEITIEGITYTRVVGKPWVGQNTNNLVETAVIANIEGDSIEAYSEVDDIYASCPIPNNHKVVQAQIDFRDYNNRYYRYFVYGKGSGFYRYDTSNGSATIGVFAPGYNYIEAYRYINGAWSVYSITSSSGMYLAVGNNYDIYYCSTDIYKGTSNTAYDKTIVVRKADGADTPRKINSFDKATDFGFYNVNIVENATVDNSPLEGAITGTLEVIDLEDKLMQRLTTKDNTYTRLYVNRVWTDWIVADLSKYDKTEVVDEKVENAINTSITTSNEYTDKRLSEFGYIGDVLETEWGVPTHGIWNNEKTPASNVLYTLKCRVDTNRESLFFFTSDISKSFKIETLSNGNKRFRIDNYNGSAIAGYYSASSTTSWASYNDTVKGHVLNGGSPSLTSYCINEIYYHDFDIYDYETGELIRRSYNAPEITDILDDFNEAVEYDKYEVFQIDNLIANTPTEEKIEGVLTVEKCDRYIQQRLINNMDNQEYVRHLKDFVWTEWKSSDSIEIDTSNLATKEELETVSNQITELQIPITDKINTFTYTNSDGMPEIYNWVDLNGFKVMWINVKHSEAEYNSGVNGAMMKTLNFPAEAQIFNQIIMANITSYNRDNDTSTLSRVVQNAEIISNVSVRGRWRHTDNNPPKIDRFTIMCWGF